MKIIQDYKLFKSKKIEKDLKEQYIRTNNWRNNFSAKISDLQPSHQSE